MKKAPIVALGIGALLGLMWFTFGPGTSPGPKPVPAVVESKAAAVRPDPGVPVGAGSLTPEEKKARVAALVGRIQQALDAKNFADHAAVFESDLPALMELDPWAGAKLAESAPAGGEWRAELLRTVAQKWPVADPQGVGKWVAGLPDPNERDTILGCACFQIADRDPSLAIRMLVQQGVGSERREVMLGNLAQQWAALDMPAAVAWARSCPPGRVRDTLLLHVALAQSKVDPEDAAAIVAQQIPPGSTQENAAIAVLQAWAKQDGDGALAWASRFPPGELRDRALREIPQISAAESGTGTLPRPQ